VRQLKSYRSQGCSQCGHRQDSQVAISETLALFLLLQMVLPMQRRFVL